MQLQQLITGCKKNDTRSQYLFVARFGEKMLRFCKRLVDDTREAEELVMDGFYKFFTSLHKFTYTSDQETEAWLTKIMGNHCKNHLIKLKTYKKRFTHQLPEMELPHDIETGISFKEILGYIAALPEGCRTIFNLYFMENMTHDKIALQLNIHIGTSCSQLNRAKMLLRDLIIKNYYDYAYREAK